MGNESVETSETKLCGKCKSDKLLVDFNKNKTKKDGHADWCSSCMRDYLQSWYYSDKVHERELQKKKSVPRNLKRQWDRTYRYGITSDEFLVLWEQQNGSCAICEKILDFTAKNGYHLDHDHNCCSGKTVCGNCIRGILCGECNLGIGKFNDDPKRLRSAANYLETRSIR